ncbi:MAG: MFS transporter [Pseudomonadota bacterium]
MSEAVQETSDVPLKTKIAFGLGATAEQVCLRSFGIFALIYYNQVLDMSGALAGFALTAALLIDAVTDPLIGSYSDRFRSKKLGRRHPFLFAAPIPIVIFYFAVFNPPGGLSEYQLFGWFLVFSVLLRACMTLFFVPHLAMGGELSKKYTERSKIMSYNFVFGYAGAAGVYWISMSVFFASTPENPNGMLNAEGYKQMSMMCAAFTLLVLYLCAFFTKDRIPHLSQPDEKTPRFSFTTFFGDIKSAVSNSNYLFLLIGYFLLSVMLGARDGFENYMNLFYFELRPEQMRYFVVGQIAGYIVAFTMTYRIHQLIDKRATIVIAACGLSITPGGPVLMNLMGLLPEMGSDAVLYWVIVFKFLGSLSGAMLSISVMSALADIADENELLYGRRQEGILYSARTFFAKADQALGLLIAGLVLEFITFPKDAKPGEVEPSIVHNLAMVDSVYLIFPGLLAACFYAGYRINRKRYAEISAALGREVA